MTILSFQGKKGKGQGGKKVRTLLKVWGEEGVNAKGEASTRIRFFWDKGEGGAFRKMGSRKKDENFVGRKWGKKKEKTQMFFDLRLRGDAINCKMTGKGSRQRGPEVE